MKALRNTRLLASCLLLAAPALAGFAGTDLFLPNVGRQAGAFPSNWYTTVWIYNPGADAVTAKLSFLQRNTANLAPPSVDVLVPPDDTLKLDNVVESLFHLQAFGALRVTAPEKLVVSSRTYSRGSGAGEPDSVGQDFAGVPASFAIGAGESAHVLGAHQAEPAAASEYRFNYGFVETTGHRATVRVTVFDGAGAQQGSEEPPPSGARARAVMGPTAPAVTPAGISRKAAAAFRSTTRSTPSPRCSTTRSSSRPT